jgi:hypothetical protein
MVASTMTGNLHYYALLCAGQQAEALMHNAPVLDSVL